MSRQPTADLRTLGGGACYLGGVEVHVIVLLVGAQVLVGMVTGRPHQHHPVTFLLAGRVQTHHRPVPLEDLIPQTHESRGESSLHL